MAADNPKSIGDSELPPISYVQEIGGSSYAGGFNYWFICAYLPILCMYLAMT